MDVFKIAVKIFAAEDTFAPDQFVPIFHHWIQNQSVEGHRLIDVADYGHVVEGPGTVLVSSEANFYTDREDGRLGLLYSRKLPLGGSFQDRLRAVVRETLKAAAKLEGEELLRGKLKFKTDEILVRLNDRLLAPPGEHTVREAMGDIKALGGWIYGDGVEIKSKFTDKTLVEFTIKAKGGPLALADMLGK